MTKSGQLALKGQASGARCQALGVTTRDNTIRDTHSHVQPLGSQLCKAALADAHANLAHQVEQERDVVQADKADAQKLARAKEVVDVGAREVRAGVAGTGGIERAGMFAQRGVK